MTDVAGVVDALGQRLQAVEELGEGRPLPLDAGFHRLGRNVLGPLEVADDHAPVGRGARRQGEAAVAHDHRGDAVPAGGGAQRIPEDLGIHVGVAVHEPGRHDLSLGVDDVARPLPNAADRHDAAMPDTDVGREARQAGSVDHHTVLDHQVVGHHSLLNRRGPRRPPRHRYRTSLRPGGATDRASEGCSVLPCAPWPTRRSAWDSWAPARTPGSGTSRASRLSPASSWWRSPTARKSRASAWRASSAWPPSIKTGGTW